MSSATKTIKTICLALAVAGTIGIFAGCDQELPERESGWEEQPQQEQQPQQEEKEGTQPITPVE
ncbi:MAG: hypothetical protein R6V56_07005 [Lentisphaeria bacterium]